MRSPPCPPRHASSLGTSLDVKKVKGQRYSIRFGITPRILCFYAMLWRRSECEFGLQYNDIRWPVDEPVSVLSFPDTSCSNSQTQERWEAWLGQVGNRTTDLVSDAHGGRHLLRLRSASLARYTATKHNTSILGISHLRFKENGLIHHHYQDLQLCWFHAHISGHFVVIYG